MGQHKSSISIKAAPERVFQTVSDIAHFSKAIPHIIKVEFLTETRKGVGTRFKETRLMKGREVATELEVMEYAENDRIRLVSIAGATTWDTVFTVKDNNGATELTLTMNAKAHSPIAAIFNLIIKGVLQKALDADMASVKEYCEEQKEN